MHAALGSLGVELAEAHQPDLILLDLHLPDLSGHQVLRAIRSLPSTARTPVVVLTADASAGLAHRLRDSGASGYLTKPLDIDQVLEYLDGVTRRPAGRRAMTGQLAIYNGMSVLVVDDNASNCALMAALLREQGMHRVHSETDARRGAAPPGGGGSGPGTARSAHAPRGRPYRADPDPAVRRGQLPAGARPHRRFHGRGPRPRAGSGGAGLPHQARRRRRSDAAHRQPAADTAAAGRAAPVRGAGAARARAALDRPCRAPRTHPGRAA